MEYLRKINKDTFLLLVIIILASVLRFFWLDKIPNAIGGDELVYVITAKSIAISGSDLTGTWNPLSVFLFNYPPNQAQAELPYFLFLPAALITQFSLFSAKITTGLFGVLNVFLIFLIASKLFNKKVGLLAAVIAAINPWFIYISRTAYESMPAVFFYLLSFYALVFFKGRKILISIPFLFLAFYSYIATKVFFIPFVFTTVFYSYFYLNKKRFKKEYLIVLASSILLVFVLLLSLMFHPSTLRGGELIGVNNQEIVRQVDAARASMIKSPLTNLLENRYTALTKVVLVKLFSIFSFNYLFLTGDNFYSIWNNGLFYYLDAVFLILGMLFVFNKERKVFFLFASLVFFATIPHLIYRISTDNFTNHISLIFPFMIIFIAVGIWEALNFFKNRIYFYTLGLITVLLYVLLTLNFFNIYFFQWTMQGNFDFSVRVVSKYADLASKSGFNVLIYTNRKSDNFTKYLFYTNSLNKNTIQEMRDNIKKGNYRVGKVEFVDCNNDLDTTDKKNIIIYDSICGVPVKYAPKILIPRLRDGGESLRIYNDRVCSKFSLKSYPTNIKISDFLIENMDAKNFCQTYISKP